MQYHEAVQSNKQFQKQYLTHTYHRAKNTLQ